MKTRTVCRGTRIDGQRCRQVRVDWQGDFWCPAHASQEGRKDIQSAARPGWLDDPSPEDHENWTSLGYYEGEGWP